MTEEERREQIKFVKTTGIAVMAIMTLLSAVIVFLGILISEPGERRFTMLMISAGAGILSVISSGLTFLRIDKIKSRGALVAGVVCMSVSITVMLILALIGLKA